MHAFWLLAAKYNIGVQVCRVGTDDNIADDPSRESYKTMEFLNACWRKPWLPSELWYPYDWEAVKLL